MHARTLAVVIGLGLVAGPALAGDQAGKQRSEASSQDQGKATMHEGKAKADPGKSQASAGQAGQDPLMKQGPAVKGHASDEVVSGRVAEISGDSVSIESGSGAAKKLELAPETVIDGKAGNQEALKEGQQVRASFSEVEGKSVAVEITSGQGASGGAEPKAKAKQEKQKEEQQQGGATQQR